LTERNEHPVSLQALRAGEARFRAVFAHAGTSIVIGDPYGRAIEVNASGQDVHGCDEAQGWLYATAAPLATLAHLIVPTAGT
jgi:hypothetical protein